MSVNFWKSTEIEANNRLARSGWNQITEFNEGGVPGFPAATRLCYIHEVTPLTRKRIVFNTQKDN